MSASSGSVFLWYCGQGVCQSVERHAIVVVDVAFFLNAENLAKIDARDCDESRVLLFGVDGEPRIVSRDVNIPDEGVGGLDRGDPDQPAPWSAGPAMRGRRVPSGSAPAANRPDMFDAQMVESPARLSQARPIDLSASLWRVLTAYNFAKRLTTLKGLTPYEYICKIWTTQPKRFTINPFQHNVGLNT
jgi:hypothetical protein